MLVAVKDSAGDPPALYVQVITGLTRPLRGFYCPFFGTYHFVSYSQKEKISNLREDANMKGYYNNSGYMGYVRGSWVLFASESDYREYMED